MGEIARPTLGEPRGRLGIDVFIAARIQIGIPDTRVIRLVPICTKDHVVRSKQTMWIVKR
jgi:hypothetical protein